MELQKNITMNLPIPLDQNKKAEIGERMAELKLSINSKEESKKAIAAEYADEIKNLESELYGLAKQFKNDAVNAEVECRVDYNVPEKGQKTITRLDTNEVVKVYDMSPQEIKAIEEPDLFSQKIEDLSQEIASQYGIIIDGLFQPEEIEDNLFIVNSSDDLNNHEIDVENIEDEELKDFIGALAIRLDSENEKHKELIEPNDHFFYAESFESDTVAWYFFKKVDPEEETEKGNVIEFDPETMDAEKIEASFSCDLLTENKIRSYFEINGVKYVTTGTVGTGNGGIVSASAFELIPVDKYDKETFTYKDLDSTRSYEGQLVTYRKKKYVLSNPIEIVFPEEVQESEFKEYELPEKVK